MNMTTMPDADPEDLRQALDEARAEVAQLREALAATSNARDDARIVEEIEGEDGGTNPFAAAVRATRMPMVIANPRLPDNPIVFVNDSFCRLCGYPREEILGRNCRFLQGPDTDPGTVKLIHDAVARVEPVLTDILNYRKTGETFWNRLLMAPVRDTAGELAYFFASQVDVTLERERLEGLEIHNAALMAEVSDRLHAQQEVAQRLQFATEAGRLGIWELDLSTSDLTSSAVFRDNHGIARDAPLSRQNLEASIHPEDRQSWAEAVARSADTLADLDVEYRVGSPGGAIRWVQVRAQVVRAGDGTPLRLAGVSLDVTESRAADLRRQVTVELGDRIRDVDDPAALAYAAAEILARRLGVTRAGFGIVDPVAETITVERDWTAPGLASFAGVLRFRDYGSYIEDLQQGNLVAIADVRQDARTNGNVAAIERLDVRALLNLPVAEQSGLVALLFITHREARVWTGQEIDLVREVAERVQVAVGRRMAERDLRQLAASLEQDVEERTRERDQLWALSEDLLVIADYDGHLIRVSPSWTRNLGWTEAALLAVDYLGITHPDDVAPVTDAVRRMRDADVPTSFETRVRHHDGSYRHIAWQLSPEPGGARLTGTGRDVTADKAQRAELDLSQESLRQAQKMEAVGQLTGGVAHDFNNLLTVIRSSVDLLKRPNLAEERRARYVAAISDTTTRAAKLTGQLLAFARRQTLKPEVFDVNRSASAIGDMIGTLTGARIRIEIGTSGVDCSVNADPSQFDTALVNMAVNARDAMGGEGTLSIDVRRASGVPARRAHPALAGDFVEVAVSDTGSGIAAADLDRIFEPFFTTKGVGQGTGLGLSQVFGFVKQSGGEILVESEVGRGTTFRLYLPRVASRVEADRGTASEAAASGAGIRVLVVEDNVEVGSFAAQTLGELGYAPVLVQDAEAALAVLARDADSFDVVFSDVVMPGMGGIELGKAIRVTYPKLPVVLTSGYSHVLADEGPQGFDLLQKPYSLDELSRVLGKAARGRQKAAAQG